METILRLAVGRKVADMSYILDALKKLEQEKNRKSRPAGKVDISGDLYAGAGIQEAGSGRLLKFSLLAVAVLMVLFFGARAVMKGMGPSGGSTAIESGKQPGVPVFPASGVSVPGTAAPQAVSGAVAVPSPAGTAAVVPETVDGDDEESRARRRGARKAAAPLAAPAVPVPSPVKPAVTMAAPAAAQPPPAMVTASPAPATVPPPNDIKVSGIAWQEERTARRAVVNGFLLKEGAMVAGARITEIMPDRVKFSLSGANFEVSFLSAGPGAGK